jgi:transposase
MATTTEQPVPEVGDLMTESPRSGGPIPRRVVTNVEKLAHVAAYREAVAQRQGGAYLREHGLYSTQLTEWRRLRDAGVLTGTGKTRASRPTAEQAVIARLTGELEMTKSRLVVTEAALEIMGKARELLAHASKSSAMGTTLGKH